MSCSEIRPFCPRKCGKCEPIQTPLGGAPPLSRCKVRYWPKAVNDRWQANDLRRILHRRENFRDAMS